ncbi:MAG: hypothetical protein ACR2MP_19415 [Streptosporangiaceae bacterium]
MPLRYIGSGPYCYANSLAMILGSESPDPSAIEVLTGSPFGIWLLDGALPFFDPPGWDPGTGLDAAIDLLGWTCELSSGGSPAEAIERLQAAAAAGPVLAGPVEFGLLLHHPGSGTAIGSDHFVVVTAVEQDMVRFHDPHGHPHATLPASDFAAAWSAETIGYHPGPYTMRTSFRAVSHVDLPTALQRSLPAAVRWLTTGQVATSGTLAGAAACQHLADLAGAGLEPWQRDHLGYFAIRVGARRLADAATWLTCIGATTAAEIADGQARLVGALQYPLVTDDRTATTGILRQLAPTYEHLRTALAAHINATPP